MSKLKIWNGSSWVTAIESGGGGTDIYNWSLGTYPITNPMTGNEEIIKYRYRPFNPQDPAVDPVTRTITGCSMKFIADDGTEMNFPITNLLEFMIYYSPYVTYFLAIAGTITFIPGSDLFLNPVEIIETTDFISQEVILGTYEFFGEEIEMKSTNFNDFKFTKYFGLPTIMSLTNVNINVTTISAKYDTVVDTDLKDILSRINGSTAIPLKIVPQTTTLAARSAEMDANTNYQQEKFHRLLLRKNEIINNLKKYAKKESEAL